MKNSNVTRPTWNDEMNQELAQIVGEQVNYWNDSTRFSLGRRDAREIREVIGNIYENPELLERSNETTRL